MQFRKIMAIMKRSLPIVAMIGSVAALAGCGARAYGTSMSIGGDAGKLTQLVSGATAASRSSQHGSQVEYLAPDGRTFLWYPGNTRPLPGRWKVEQRSLGALICFAYPPSSFNPATGQSGGDWQCQDGGNYVVAQSEFLDGDPFELSSGKLPFITPKGKWLTPEEMMTLWGRPATGLHNRLELPVL